MPYKKKRRWPGRAAAAKNTEDEDTHQTDTNEAEENDNDDSLEIHTATASIAEAATRNHCVYCHQDESDDPSGENEDEYLACSVCGDNAHQQCAKDQDSLKPGTDLEDWRCPGCVANALEPPATDRMRRLSASSSRMARNLLAAGQGTSRPLKHSIFNTLILDDDPLDGSRALRKRKASSEARDVRPESIKKQKRRSGSQSEALTDNASRISVTEEQPDEVVALEPVPESEEVQQDSEDEEVDREIEDQPEAESEGETPAQEEIEVQNDDSEKASDEPSPELVTSDPAAVDKVVPVEESKAEVPKLKAVKVKPRPKSTSKPRGGAPRGRVVRAYRGRGPSARRRGGPGRGHKGPRIWNRAPGDNEADISQIPDKAVESEAEFEAGPENPMIIESTSQSLVLLFRLDPSKLKTRFKKKSRSLTFGAMPNPPRALDHSSHAAPFYSLHDKEAEELKSKPYGGILSEEDADTSRTFPMPVDRAMFEEARQKAEEEWKRKTEADEGDQESKNRKISGPPSKIKCISFGGYEIETWYAAPYPEEYSRNRVLYICEFCLKYMSSDYVAWRHKLKCPAKHPPGDEIYRHKSISVFEIDGRKQPVYCQNLCLLAKLFLGSKTLYYDVEPFLFYIMTEYNELGCHFVGYFSKEKRPSSMNNVSCILTLPIHQRKGYGNLLIDFSYLLTRVEKKTGSPEKPLSDMGLVSYRNYWRLVLSYILVDQKDPISITNISEKTGMTADDIVAALEALRALVRDPVTKTYALRLDTEYYKQCIESWEAKNYVRLNPDALIWTPYIMGRGNLATYDRAPAISTVAPRDDEEVDKSVAAEEGIQQGTGPESSIQGQVNGTSDHELDRPVVQVNGTSIDGEEESILQTTEEPLMNGHYEPTMPTTPQTFGAETPRPKSISPIPPTRYEVYPPVVGPTKQRGRGGARGRGGRGGASASARRTGKPFSAVAGKLALTRDILSSNNASSPSRGGRGKPLGNGNTDPGMISQDEDDEEGEEEEEEVDAEEGGFVSDKAEDEDEFEVDDTRRVSVSEDADSYNEVEDEEEEEEEEEEDSVSAISIPDEAEDEDEDELISPTRGQGRGRAGVRSSTRGASRGRARGTGRGGASGRTRGRGVYASPEIGTEEEEEEDENEEDVDNDEEEDAEGEEEETNSNASESAEEEEEDAEEADDSAEAEVDVETATADSEEDAEGEIDEDDV